MKNILIIICFNILLLASCVSCTDEILNKNIYWKNKICGKNLIFDCGVGYPIYKNTVVFHSTPQPWGDIRESILYGLDTETGKERWRLTNADFAPKKSLVLNCSFGTYQKENVLIACDDVYKPSSPNGERFIYGIDIEHGKVLWVTQFPNEYWSIGNTIRGDDKFAYVNAISDNKCSLLCVNIETGVLTSVIDILSNVDLSEEINVLNSKFAGYYFSDIYKNNSGDDMVALSLMS